MQVDDLDAGKTESLPGRLPQFGVAGERQRALRRRLLPDGGLDGGPVGVESLAAALSEERGTIEDVVEPYLIQQGFLVRTARGRMASAKAYRHLGLNPPPRRDQPAPTDLFDAERDVGG